MGPMNTAMNLVAEPFLIFKNTMLEKFVKSRTLIIIVYINYT